MLGKREVVSVIACWQSKSTGDLQGSQMEGGIGVTPDRECEGYVEGLRNNLWAELGMSLILKKSVQDFVVDQAWSI